MPELTATSGSGFLSERTQLSEERIGRLERVGREDEEDDKEERPTERPATAPLSSTGAGARTRVNESEAAMDSEQMFWEGEVRQTACQFSDPRKDGRPTFSLTDVLGKKSDLQFAILSTFAINFGWIYEFFDPSVPVILIADPERDDDEETSAMGKYIKPNWLCVTPGMREGRGIMHMKFMLLFYKTARLRVVVSSANLISHDWIGIENTVWLQDIPPHTAPDRHLVDDDGFAAVMVHVFGALSVDYALKITRRRHPSIPLIDPSTLRTDFDFSKVCVQLVPSIAGKHEGWQAVLRSGHTRLMKAVQAIGIGARRGKELVLEYQGSSIGQYSTQWMNEFYYSASGESARDWLDEPKARRARLPWPPVKVVFPTVGTVLASASGASGARTIFLMKRHWDLPQFPRKLFVDSISKGGRSLMHSKVIIATFRNAPRVSISSSSGSSATAPKEEENNEVVVSDDLGWAYIGSHNFTASAWGYLSGSAANPILNNVNFELGIVFPLKDEVMVQQIACFERPVKAYMWRDRPWIQGEYRGSEVSATEM